MKFNKIKDYTIIASGALMYASSVVIFTAPNNIAPGGLTGIGTLLNYLFSIPIGTFILVMNVPLFLLGYKSLGRGFIIKTIIGTVLTSVFIDVLAPFVPEYRGDMMLSCLFGGFFNGTGLALIFSRGGSSGGTDIIAATLHKRFPQLSIGYIILASDAIVVTVAAFVYNSIESGLYAVIAIFVSSKLIDVITYGTSRDNGKLMFIVTDKYEEILSALLNKVSRGVTVVDAQGGYSKTEKKLLLCALRPHQVFKANSVTKILDPNAFIIVTTAGTINGLGFANQM